MSPLTFKHFSGVLQENLLRAWEGVHKTAERLSASNPRGNGEFLPEDDFEEGEENCKDLYPWL